MGRSSEAYLAQSGKRSGAICSISGCKSHANGSRGMCKSHYSRWWRHGDAEAGRVADGAQLSWIEQHVRYTSDHCLVWPYRDGEKRKSMQFRGRQAVASRVMCILAHGEPPTPQHEAAHSCGKGHIGCLNPKHLRWATKAENNEDKFSHGTVLRGENHACAKLTPEQALEIFISVEPSAELAQKYKISESTISAIWCGRRWKHLTGGRRHV